MLDAHLEMGMYELCGDYDNQNYYSSHGSPKAPEKISVLYLHRMNDLSFKCAIGQVVLMEDMPTANLTVRLAL